uniref:Retrotransposon Copia-like N-terminal domain-containing protein n=1 Tax=Solanum tuberosum TaxID=4113 RepID=M1BMN2_SOLTU
MIGAENIPSTEGTSTGGDASSALYVHPSDSPGMVLVSVQFDGIGYRSWRRGVMRALSVKNKLGFIDGSCGPTGRNYKTSFSNNNYSGSNSTSGNNKNYGGSNYYSGSSSNRNAMFCDFCKKTGHIREKCYKLNGYPQGHNNQANRNNGFHARHNNNHEYKGKRVVANVHGSPDDMMPAQGEDCPQGNHNQNATLTKDQYAHNMNLLQHFRVEGEDSTNSNTCAGSVNFTGPFSEEASSAWK